MRIRDTQHRDGRRPPEGMTCLDVLDGNVGTLARTGDYAHERGLEGGGALIHLQDGGTADRADVTMLSASDFARQQAIGCPPISEPSLARVAGHVTAVDASP